MRPGTVDPVNHLQHEDATALESDSRKAGRQSGRSCYRFDTCRFAIPGKPGGRAADRGTKEVEAVVEAGILFSGAGCEGGGLSEACSSSGGRRADLRPEHGVDSVRIASGILQESTQKLAASVSSLQHDSVELIARTAQLVSLFACEIFYGDAAAVRPNQQQLLSIAHFALREEGDPLLGGDRHPLREAARCGEQDEGASIIRVCGLFDAEDDPAGFGIPIRPRATDQR